MARNVWEQLDRLWESTEGPNVTVQIPRQWAEELLRALSTALEIEDEGDIDMDGPHMEPDEDDLGGPPDMDADDMGDMGGGDDEMPELPAGDDSDEEEAGDDGDDDDEDDDEDEMEEEGTDPETDLTRPKTALGESRRRDGRTLTERRSPIGEKHIGFGKLAGILKRKGAENPGGLAKSIGDKKYGKRGMAAKSKAGRK